MENTPKWLEDFLNKKTTNMETLATERLLSFGEKAVGITFNPGGSDLVNGIKNICATLIDELDAQRNNSSNGEVKAQYTLAIRKIQEGQMWGVKAATWQY